MNWKNDNPSYDRSGLPADIKARVELEDVMIDAEEEMEIAEILQDKSQESKEMYFKGREDYCTSLIKRMERQRSLIESLREKERKLHNI